jgi:hypothetical protein
MCRMFELYSIRIVDVENFDYPKHSLIGSLVLSISFSGRKKWINSTNFRGILTEKDSLIRMNSSWQNREKWRTIVVTKHLLHSQCSLLLKTAIKPHLWFHWILNEREGWVLMNSYLWQLVNALVKNLSIVLSLSRFNQSSLLLFFSYLGTQGY